jgi:hypothetical protein
LIRRAHDKGLKLVAGIQLMIDGIKVQARLLGHISRGAWFIFRAHELKVRISHAHFGQNGLQQLAVGFRQPLPENPGRDADHEFAVFRSLLTGRTKPGGEAMRVDPPFHVLQNFFPGIHSLKTLKKAKRAHPSYFHNCGKTVEKHNHVNLMRLQSVSGLTP